MTTGQIDHNLTTLDDDRATALTEVLLKLAHQQNKWGEQNHNLDRWNSIELEELGEVARAGLRMREDPTNYRDNFEAVLDEWADVAAVAITAYAAIYRRYVRQVQAHEERQAPR